MKSNFRNRIEERNRPRVTMHKFNARVMAEEAVQAAYRREEDKRLAVDKRMSYLIVSLAEKQPVCKAFRAAAYDSEPEQLNVVKEDT